MNRVVYILVGTWQFLAVPKIRDERGLSQSAENAILLAGAVAVASIVIGAITVYVTNHMPK